MVTFYFRTVEWKIPVNVLEIRFIYLDTTVLKCTVFSVDPLSKTSDFHERNHEDKEIQYGRLIDY